MTGKIKSGATDRRATEDKRLTDAELDEIVGGLQATASDTKRSPRRTVAFNAPIKEWDTVGVTD